MSQTDFDQIINGNQPITLDPELMEAAFRNARRHRSEAFMRGLQRMRDAFSRKQENSTTSVVPHH